MHRFYTAETDGRCFLRGEDVRHALRVLRLCDGDEIEALRNGERWRARLCLRGQEAPEVCLLERLPDAESPVNVTLYQGLPKAEKMDWIVQKCTELGIGSVRPVLMERTVVQGKKQALERRRDRWQAIAEEAVKQCGRSRVPPVSEPAPLSDLLGDMRGLDVLLVPWEEESAEGERSLPAVLGKLGPISSAGILIGPEGGISGREIALLREKVGGVQTVSLGPRILRTETAAVAATANVMMLCGAM